jgi:hypothetical protein
MRNRTMPWTALPLAALCFGMASASAQVYVAPDGKPDGKGTIEAPYDLQTAFNGPAWLKPGMTVWMLGGQYKGYFEQKKECSGTKEQPIVFRPAQGARATIIGGVRIYGSNTRLMNFEVTNPNVLERASPVHYFEGDNTTIANLILHHNGTAEVGANGISCFWSITNATIYGCLVYEVGYGTRALSPHAHGIYTQNIQGTGTKRIEDNIFFRSPAWGIHAYGSDQARVDDYVIRRNIIFRQGSVGAQVGGGNPSKNIVFEENYFYGNDSMACMIGYGADGSEGLSFRRNYMAGAPKSRLCFQLLGYKDGTIRDNTFCALEAGPLVGLKPPGRNAPPAYDWDNNTYSFHKSFSGISDEPKLFAVMPGKFLSFDEWRNLGFDKNSTLSTGKPKTTVSFVLANRYEPGRAHVAVYNWERTAKVEIDLSKVLAKGAPFMVLDAQDYFGKPLIEGEWGGGKVAVPMPPRDPSPEFAALVVLSGDAIAYSGRGETAGK